MTVREVAALLKLDEKTVRRKITSGELPAIRLGGTGSPVRVDPVELDKWLFSPEEAA